MYIYKCPSNTGETWRLNPKNPGDGGHPHYTIYYTGLSPCMAYRADAGVLLLDGEAGRGVEGALDAMWFPDDVA